MTQKEIAARLNISQATVSMALRGSKRISASVTAAVRKLAEEEQYQPNLAGRMLRHRTSNFIGIIFPAMNSSFFSHLFHELRKILSDSGYLVYVSEAEDAAATREAFGMLRQLNAAGIITYGWCLDVMMRECLGRIPVVVFDGEDSKDMPVSHIRVDSSDAVAHLAQRFYETGCRRPFVMAPDPSAPRFAPFVSFWKEKGITVSEILAESTLSEHASDAMRNYLQLKGSAPDALPDCIFCYNDDMARGVLNLLHKNKIRIPEDTLLSGFDNSDAGRFSIPSITTIELSQSLIAEALVRELYLVMRDINRAEKFTLTTVLLERESSDPERFRKSS